MAVHVSDLNHVFELFKNKFEIWTTFTKKNWKNNSKTNSKSEKISKTNLNMKKIQQQI
jgi:hypothetical protein